MPSTNMPHPTKLELCETPASYTDWRKNALTNTPSGRARIGFVPTMGALHDGHMTLIEQARKQCQYVVVSIFVNPLQFLPHEDLDRYPRPLERDLDLCRSAGVDAVFHPSVEDMYGTDRSNVTKIVPPSAMTETMEGAFRPGFFTGVATVVCKLFNMIQPDVAYFGEKDYQQLQVVTRMVADLNMPLRIQPVATVREPDGLAMSSRNVYLKAEQRALAPILHATLKQVRDNVLGGTAPESALAAGRTQLRETGGIELQYLELRDAHTLSAGEIADDFVVLVAAKLGEVRLIDNLISRRS